MRRRGGSQFASKRGGAAARARAAASALAAVGFACAAMLLAAPASAADVAKGRQKAEQVCAVCHGRLGIASAPETPNLAGEPAGYLARQLRAFKSGARQHEVMSVIAKPLSDEEIDNLTAWFSTIRVEATAP